MIRLPVFGVPVERSRSADDLRAGVGPGLTAVLSSDSEAGRWTSQPDDVAENNCPQDAASFATLRRECGNRRRKAGVEGDDEGSKSRADAARRTWKTARSPPHIHHALSSATRRWAASIPADSLCPPWRANGASATDAAASVGAFPVAALPVAAWCMSM